MKYDSFVFIGHGTSEKTSKYDPGAVSGNFVEYKIAEKIVQAAKGYLDKISDLKIHYDENNYIDNDLQGNTYSKKSGIVVHLNAGGGTGVEIIVPCKEDYLVADVNITKNISNLLGIRNRGVKSRIYDTEKFIYREHGKAISDTDYYGEIRQAWKQGISLAILEVGFIDTDDIYKITGNIERLGYEVANYIAFNCGKEIKEERIYTVNKGDTLYSISRKLGVSLETLIYKNNISNPNKIREGANLKY